MLRIHCYQTLPLLIIMAFLSCSVNAQEYFQQEVNYRIDVALNDKHHILTGFETIAYTNNSPDDLKFIYFHLWPNAYKTNQSTLAEEQFKSEGKHHLFDHNDQQGFIDSLHFRVNGKNVSWDYHSGHPDICRINLNNPIQPGETITITTPFRVKIPLGVTSRFGHIEQSYKITQWYPKPAVYDRYGWHPMPYRDMGEFYSEFGSFEVNITLPENYVVAASGQLQTKSEVEWLNNRAIESKGKFSFDRGNMEIPISAEQNKTLRYTLDSTHDFAWFADKRYHVIKDSVKLPHSGRHVTTWSYFTNDQAELWRNSTNYINDALTYYSQWYGDYAYDNCSAVLGPPGSRGNGMEYPTITVIGHTQQPEMLEHVIMHEVGHNWFYGMLGFNERRYPYLDEGINTFSEIRYMQNKYQNKNKLHEMLGINKGLATFLGADHLHFQFIHDLSYLLVARQNLDQPINTSSAEFSQTNYAAISYSKTGLAFQHLMHFLGEEQFNTIMQDFFQQWKFKHPYPGDLENVFKKHSNKDLSWFFDDVLQSTGKIDYAIKKAKDNRLLITNQGDIEAPLKIAGYRNQEQRFSRWYSGFHGSQWLDIPNLDADLYKIDPNKNMLELYRHNNTLKTKGLFKTFEPLKLQFFGLFNNPDYTQIHYFPSIGWNHYDNTMLGGLLYDAPLPPDRFDAYLAPMYSTANKNLSGLGELAYHIFPDKTFRQIQVKLSGKRFGYSEEASHFFNRIQSEAIWTFKKPDHRMRVISEIRYSGTYATLLPEILAGEKNPGSAFYHKISLLHDRTRKKINPHRFKAHIELSGDFVKTALEARYKLSYYKDKGLTFRLFGGTFLYQTADLPWSYAFHLSGGSGPDDYTFDQTFLGRFEDPADDLDNQLLTQQFYPDDGAFALYTPVGITKDWLVTLNITSSLPVISDLPVELYGNMGTFGRSKPVTPDISNTDWALESGVKFSFMGFLDLYFPVFASHNLEKTGNHINNRYGEKIRFHLKFDKVKPSEIFKFMGL